MILVYMVFGALLNSAGPIILLSVQSLGVPRTDAALLDAYRDLPIAVVSFLVAALLPRLGLRRAMLIGLVTRDERSHASFTSLIEGLFMCGLLGGYWLFSRGADNADPGSRAWLEVYWIMAAVVATSFLLLAVSPLDESRARPAPASLGADFVAMWRLVLSRLVFVFLLSAFLYVLIEQGIGTWLPTFNNEVLKMPTAMSVGLAVLMPLSTAVGRLTSAAVIARLGWYPVVNACVAASAALIQLAMPLTCGLQAHPAMSWAHAPAVAYVVPLIGLFLAPIYPTINSAMLCALPKPQHAAMTGLIVIFSALGGSFGSFVTGRLFVAFDGQTAFTLLLAPAGALALFLWLFQRGLK